MQMKFDIREHNSPRNNAQFVFFLFKAVGTKGPGAIRADFGPMLEINSNVIKI